jgi:hypothetical protein
MTSLWNAKIESRRYGHGLPDTFLNIRNKKSNFLNRPYHGILRMATKILILKAKLHIKPANSASEHHLR